MKKYFPSLRIIAILCLVGIFLFGCFILTTTVAGASTLF